MVKNRKIFFLVICTLITAILISFMVYINKDKADKITKIDFPVVGGDIPSDVDYEIAENVSFDDARLKGAGKLSDAVYKLKNNKIEKSKISDLKKVFKLEQAEETDMGEVLTYQNKEGTLEIYENGTFVFNVKNKNFDKPVNLSDTKCKEIASEFLDSNNLLPNDFYESGISHETRTAVNNPNDSLVIRKHVYFNRKVNEKKVYGVSRIIVSLGVDGKIESINYLNRDIESLKGDNISIKSYDEALADLKLHKGTVRMNEDTKKVKINNVNIVYWEDSSPTSKQSHIQPVYHFKGDAINSDGKKDIFEAFIPAIPENMTQSIKSNYKLIPGDKKPIDSNSIKDFSNKPMKDIKLK
ncbi:hypothetical protein [Clostridium sp. DJ247]|uniref:hypothetical protein n=1 Tax=Clostridium sp. DJ247 TaxID=2726188 RepID=UPI0016264EA4|nr:hypothetical protein [Clostridium sp. DJ247]MBC2581524.1 hypothetical protein [Clostridium sp. DJ247]